MTVRPEDLSGDARRRYDTWRGLGLSEAAAMGELARDGLLPAAGRAPGDPVQERLRAAFLELGLTEAQASVAVQGRGGSPRRSAGSAHEPRGGGGINDMIELDRMFEDYWVDYWGKLGYSRPVVEEARRRWKASVLAEGYANEAERHRRAAAAAPAKPKKAASARSAKSRSGTPAARSVVGIHETLGPRPGGR